MKDNKRNVLIITWRGPREFEVKGEGSRDIQDKLRCATILNCTLKVCLWFTIGRLEVLDCEYIRGPYQFAFNWSGLHCTEVELLELRSVDLRLASQVLKGYLRYEGSRRHRMLCQ